MDLSDNLIVRRRLKKFGTGDDQEWYSKEIVVKSYKKFGKPTKKYSFLESENNKVFNFLIQTLKTPLLPFKLFKKIFDF